ncbi:MAG: hypothetical protein UT84_C0001G0008 [Candidatus Curtissbacteria bacterium GW2011_GWA1_40_16]|uniref:Uncharacterized protein n=1 Tax=Candidatus Curtissbacteria bacterium GW2011_GWA1_40_16 TaxID=1618405 RepID=A0A0G0RFU1_9BACT|nr:MAG: hypothetical protein UT84_C0001G0008 [Candidatus Curtissbacteria bacterium GW2011_GWA1_40_16]
MPERLRQTPESPYELNAEFIGFTKDQEKRARQYIQDLGMPAQNIKRVVYREARRGEEDILGTWELYNGTLTFYKNLERFPPIAQLKTVAHEQSHSVSSLDPKNEKLYGGRQEQLIAARHIEAVANQSIITRKYLNGYQAHLHRQYERDEIDFTRFAEETQAIMMELRFTNPEHLEKIQKAQFVQIRKINSKHQGPAIMPVAIMTTEAQAQKGLVGVDRTLSKLIPHLQTKADIDSHVAEVRRKFLERGPIFPNRISKAA